MELGRIYYLPDEKKPRIIVHHVEGGYEFRFQIDPENNDMVISEQVAHDKSSKTDTLSSEQKKALDALRDQLNKNNPGSVK